ncbi:MAG: nucleotidyltransferase domain-containing protein [Armatimonadota bacterium]
MVVSSRRSKSAGLFTPSQQSLLRRIKAAILAIAPGTRVFLFGSRARGEAQPDSDWDLLLLVKGPVSQALKDQIRRRLYEIEWDAGEVISSLVYSQDDWNTPLFSAMPLHENVSREAIQL